ncbi:MAG: insulinase family protein [Verrucomicrobia bacterium]|nr:insulinase family protein [Verrucomicrobiota bacterium]
MYHVTRLANGLTIATAEMPHMASVSLGIWVGVGGRYEPAEISGISHFIEHLLFKGTKRRNAEQISQSVEGIGGYLNAWTSEENTCFYSKARYDCFDELLDVLSDMFLNSTFHPLEIEKERLVIKEELAMYRDQPQQYVQELLNETMWPKQPLGRTLTGSEETIDTITRKHLLEYFCQHYISPCTLIVAAGNLRHETLVTKITKMARHFHIGPRPQFPAVIEKQSVPLIRLHTKRTEQTQIALGIRTCSRHDDRRYALRLLNCVLGENMSSRLFQTVREENGLAYSIYSSPSYFADTGDLVISAGVETTKISKSLKLIVQELRKLTEKTISAGELRRARDYVIGQLDMSLESTEPQMMWAGEHLISYGRILQPGEVRNRISEVTAAQIRNAARGFFRTERLNLALVSPLKKTDGLHKLLTI